MASFLQSRRVLYGAPTDDQIEKFWFEVRLAFEGAVAAGLVYKNETKHIIELPGTEVRIRAKTAFNANTLRGDYADVLILDEAQLMDRDVWVSVGAPMLLDNDGIAIIAFTPPSLHTLQRTAARDPRWVSSLFKRAKNDKTGRMESFHFTSHQNPYLSKDALDEIAEDMTERAYRQEIEAIDDDSVPGALWKWDSFDWEGFRVDEPPALERLVIGLDPSGSRRGDEVGIVACARDTRPTREQHGYVLADESMQGSPDEWASKTVELYHRLKADAIIAETNFGGDMVTSVLRNKDPNVRIKKVTASRGKQVRAEPIAGLYEQRRIHHVGRFGALEAQCVEWTPSSPNSPDRMDALVWGMTDLFETRGVGLA